MRSFLVVTMVVCNAAYLINLQFMEEYVIVGKMTAAQFAFASDMGLMLTAFTALSILMDLIPTGERR